MTSSLDRRESYLLQEAAGLRAEIIGHQAERYRVDRFGLTAVVAIYAWVISSDARGALILPPVIALVAALRQLSIFASIRQAATYLRRIETEMCGEAGGWEIWLKTGNVPKNNTILSHVVWFFVLGVTVVVTLAERQGTSLIDLFIPPSQAEAS